MYLFTLNLLLQIVLLCIHTYFKSVDYLDALMLQYVPYLSRILVRVQPANTQFVLTRLCRDSIRRVQGGHLVYGINAIFATQIRNKRKIMYERRYTFRGSLS